MKQFIFYQGMIHQMSCLNTTQQNRVGERKNRTLLEITRAVLIKSHSAASFWLEALAIATYLTNLLSSKPLNYKTLLSTLGSFVSLPSLIPFLLVFFGYIAYVYLLKQIKTKLEPRAIKCVFLGYGVNQKGYLCFYPLYNRMYTTMVVISLNSPIIIPSLVLRGRHHLSNCD